MNQRTVPSSTASSAPSQRLAREPEILIRISGTSFPPYPCKLRGLTKGVLHVLSSRPIANATEVTAIFGDVTILGAVQYSSRKEETYLICITVNPQTEKNGRRELRLPLIRTCSVTSLEDGSSDKLQSVITDISASGMGLKLPRPVEPGTMICVHTEDFVGVGHLLHCRRVQDDGYFGAGMELTDILWNDKNEKEEKEEKDEKNAAGKNWLRSLLRVAKKAVAA